MVLTGMGSLRGAGALPGPSANAVSPAMLHAAPRTIGGQMRTRTVRRFRRADAGGYWTAAPSRAGTVVEQVKLSIRPARHALAIGDGVLVA